MEPFMKRLKQLSSDQLIQLKASIKNEEVQRKDEKRRSIISEKLPTVSKLPNFKPLIDINSRNLIGLKFAGQDPLSITIYFGAYNGVYYNCDVKAIGSIVTTNNGCLIDEPVYLLKDADETSHLEHLENTKYGITRESAKEILALLHK